MNILDALRDPELFAPHFRPPESWAAWRAALAALFALPMTDEQRAIFRLHSGREAAPATAAREGWFVVGRRGGKSRIAALVAVYLATFRDYSKILAPGERGTLMVIAADRRQARTVLRYIRGLLDTTPPLAAMVERCIAESIDLTNGVTIEVHTASFRAVRGYTLIGAVCDEVAFWPTAEDSAEPDREIIAALRPGMATVPGALLLAISSPYARRGELWRAYERHFGKDGDVLVWQAPSRAMNPSVPQSLVDAAAIEDESSALAEYGAEFRRDVESFVSLEVVDAVTVADRVELPPATTAYRYCAFADPAGGSGADSMTLAIAHAEGLVVVLDALREVRPPFSPDVVCKDFAAILHNYNVRRIQGDRYAGAWPTERFAAHGVTYEPSVLVKSDIYGALLPLLNARRVELVNDARLKRQLLGLERRTARSGKDSIDHAPRGHDDVANAAAGALVAAHGAHARTARAINVPWG